MAHPDANIIFGAVVGDALGEEVRVTVVAAGFDKVTPVAESPFESRLSRLLEEPGEAGAEEPLPSILAEDDEDRVFTDGERPPPSRSTPRRT